VALIAEIENEAEIEHETVSKSDGISPETIRAAGHQGRVSQEFSMRNRTVEAEMRPGGHV
jgi:hypothetical protein